VAKNAFEQWVARCGTAAGASLSAQELLILHMIGYNLRRKRTSDICFALKVEDTHTVAYAIRKLVRLDLVAAERVGKETFYQPSPAGAALIERYAEIRRRCLIRSLSVLDDEELDLSALSDLLRALSGFYEQAARRAETST
jgi:predicted MarR family transcription regulator